MSFAHQTGDPNVDITEYERAQPGPHYVSGFEEVIASYKNDDGSPFFKEINGEPRIMINLRTPTGDVGPTFSGTPAEFWSLVNAFGGKVEADYSNRMSATMITRGIESANAAGKRVKAMANDDGYLKYMPYDAHPSDGAYTVRFVDAHRTDYDTGNYHFSVVKGSNGSFESLIFDFEIIGDGTGKKCVWNGYVVSKFFNNAFTNEYTANGKTITAEEIGKPLFVRDENTGGIPAFVKDWENFVQFFAPSVNDHEWNVDPGMSNYGVNEVHEPQYVIIGAAKEEKLAVRAWLEEAGRKSRRFTIDIRGLAKTNLDPIDVEAQNAEETSQAPEVNDLITYIESRWDDVDVFDQSEGNEVVFTEAGRTWARDTLGGENGPWSRAGLGKAERDAGIGSLTGEQIEKLIAELKKEHDDLPTLEDAEEVGW